MTKQMIWRSFMVSLTACLLLVSGCTQEPVTPAEQVSPTVESTDTPIDPTATVEEVAAEEVEAEPTVAEVVESAELTPTKEAELSAEPAMVEPIEVTYVTPPQTEGPYYPVHKPDDRDNDLVRFAGADGTPAGSVLDLSGKIYDATGMPLRGLLIEIWQTDSNGVYDHPGDPSTNDRDMNFQFYGEAITADDGSFAFRTIMPGKYEPRPVHIHYKVKADGQELLTSQMYFEGDPELANDRIFSGSGDGVHMLVALSDGQDDAGNPILVGVRDVVLSMELPEYHAAVGTSDGAMEEISAECRCKRRVSRSVRQGQPLGRS